MRLICLTLIVILLILALSAGGQVSAATPTPSATLKPIGATPTSIYIYLHATPTNLTVVPMNVTMDFQADPILTADLAINIYRYWNKDHLIDIIASAGLALFVVGLLIRFIGRTTRTNN